MKQTLEEVAERLIFKTIGGNYGIMSSDENDQVDGYYNTYEEAYLTLKLKWQQERSQKIVPFDACNIEVFAIKPDENGKLFAYIGYKIANGNFHFNVVPFTEPQQERSYSEEEVEKLIIDFLFSKGIGREVENVKEWFKQFKKK